MKRFILLNIIIAILISAVGCEDFNTSDSDAESDVTESTYIHPETERTAISDETETTVTNTESISASFLTSMEDIVLYDTDGQEQSYSFTYCDETFSAYYWTDNWRIIDSYKIQNKDDITIICQVLSDTHPIHSADFSGYRTAGDMAYEWIQHNLAYQLLPDSSPWKKSAKDVDLDPADQGKSAYDILKERFNLNSVLP